MESSYQLNNHCTKLVWADREGAENEPEALLPLAEVLVSVSLKVGQH